MKNCCQVLLDCHIYILILAGQTNFFNFFYTLGKISLFVFKRECAISETPQYFGFADSDNSAIGVYRT